MVYPGHSGALTHEANVYQTLLDIGGDAKAEAIRIVREAFRGAAPDLSGSDEPVLLDGRQAEDAFETILSHVEAVLFDLCSRHDYRQMLHLSRMCSVVPDLMWQDANHEDRRVRTLSADRWILRCSPRLLPHDHVIVGPGDYRLREIPKGMCYDAAKIHALAQFHQRQVEERIRFNFMRLVSSRNDGVRGPTLRLHDDPRIGWELHSAELAASLELFYQRAQHKNADLAWWGLGDVDLGGELFALSADPNPSLDSASPPFQPRAIALDAWGEYGRRFASLFERDTGMPAGHFWAISRALGRLGLEAAVADGGRFQRWVSLTATIPLRRVDLVGGNLARRAAAELRGLPSPDGAQGLERSVDRYVRLASSTPDTPALRAAPATAESPRSDPDASATVRSTFYPYIIHGTDDQEYWIVDYLMTVPFIRGMVNEIEFSPSASTTSSGNHDASVRTSVFDAHLAAALVEIPGYREAFAAHRPDPNLPNVVFFFNEGAESREIDVPVRVGEVLVAVQTWTPAVNRRTMAGERRAMEKRWNSARDKLRDTDKKYTDYLLGDDEGRGHMRSEGLTCILPVVCSPYAEPLVSLMGEFWLRPLPLGSPETQVEGSVPRILTPSELIGFLGDVTEQDLKVLCEGNHWTL